MAAIEKAAAQLKKLRRKGLREIRVRGAQEISKLAGRMLSVATGEMSDAKFLRSVRPARRGRSAEQAAASMFRGGQRPPMFPFSTVAGQRPTLNAEFLTLMKRRFAG